MLRDKWSSPRLCLSVIIPAHNEEKYIGACLDAVHTELAANARSGAFEVLVVDNASSDRTAAIARAHPGVRVVPEPRKGLTHARQRGLEAARGGILAYVDADTRMPPGWIARVSEAFDRDETLACVSGPYHYYDATPAESAFVRLYWRLIAAPAYSLTGFMVVGGNFAARTESLVRVGGFDTTIPFYGEDTNIARRLAQVGRVRFDRALVMPTSARRLHAEGSIVTALRYGANFVGEAFLGRPVTLRYRDVR